MHIIDAYNQLFTGVVDKQTVAFRIYAANYPEFISYGYKSIVNICVDCEKRPPNGSLKESISIQ